MSRRRVASIYPAIWALNPLAIAGRQDENDENPQFPAGESFAKLPSHLQRPEPQLWFPSVSVAGSVG